MDYITIFLCSLSISLYFCAYDRTKRWFSRRMAGSAPLYDFGDGVARSYGIKPLCY